MTAITGHTTRAIGTILTASIYNADHTNHITNANALNAGKVEVGALVDYYTSIEVDALVAGLTREALTSDRTYYVRTDGDDAHDGSANSAIKAFLTVQHAIDVIEQTLDLAGFNAIVQIEDGTFTDQIVVEGPLVGQGSIVIQGNSGTPGNVIISPTLSNQIQGAVDVTNAQVIVKDLNITVAGAGSGIVANEGANVSFGNIEFGDVIDQHLWARRGGLIEAIDDYAIVGDAVSHMLTDHRSMMIINNTTVTLTGSPAFTIFMRAFWGSYTDVRLNTYTGAATGKRFSLSSNAVVEGPTSDTYFPGDAAGTAIGGSFYEPHGDVEAFEIIVGDETTNLSTGTGKATFFMPYDFHITELIAAVVTAQASGTILTIDVNDDGASILTTKLTIDNTEKTSITAAIPPVISDPDLAKGTPVSIDIDQIGTAGAKGLKILLVGYRSA